MAEQAEKTFLMKSSDGAEFVVSDLEASQSLTIQEDIKFWLSYKNAYHGIHLAVKSNALSKVLEYCRRSHASAGGEPHWGEKFVDVDDETLFDIIIVSYLHPLCKINRIGSGNS